MFRERVIYLVYSMDDDGLFVGKKGEGDDTFRPAVLFCLHGASHWDNAPTARVRGGEHFPSVQALCLGENVITFIQYRY